MGYPVPDGRSFYSDAWCRRTGAAANIDAGYGYAREHLGLPVIVKANDGASGAGVTLVSNKRQYYRAMRAVFDELGKHVALVQRKVDGNDYRIIVLDGEVVSACQRLPLSVTGDGRHTIAQLLRTKLDDLADAGRHIILASRDYRVAMRLERIGKTWHTVPDEGEHVVLVDTANGSTGSDRIDLTEAIHPEVRRMASRIARDSGLRYCGIDLMTPGSIEQPLRSYTIIELDGAPALCLLNGMGTKQRRLETIIEKVLRAMTRPAR
jgi:D-alanine-D-alanine ligase-like ATP-grasp enzyme